MPPLEPTSPAEESSSKRVQVLVDGVELITHAPPEEERITDEDILRRFSQTDQAVNYMNFLFMGNQDYIINFVNQARRERESYSVSNLLRLLHSVTPPALPAGPRKSR